MKSGDFSISRDDDYYRKEFAGIADRAFVQRTFASRSALVAKKPVNGHRMWADYHGQAYDESAFDLVEGMWDHDHCDLCWFTITDGFTYWENSNRIKRLCDACYEAFTKAPPILNSN
jgi:hypothetical protein